MVRGCALWCIRFAMHFSELLSSIDSEISRLEQVALFSRVMTDLQPYVGAKLRKNEA